MSARDGEPARLLVGFEVTDGTASHGGNDADSETPRERAASVRVAGSESWEPAGQLENVRRETPFDDTAVRLVRGHSEGTVVSEWHHHGDNHVFGFVLDGDGYVEWGPGEGERVFVDTEECFHIRAGFVHRDRSDSPGRQEYVLWLTGSEPRTVTVGEPVESRECDG